MNGKTLVVVVFPDEPSILESEIAGRPAGDYLLKSLNEWNEAEVKVAVDGNNRSRLLLEKFPNMTECRLAEPHSVSLTGNGLLIIDGCLTQRCQKYSL